MRLCLAQINPLIGDIQGNGELILNACRKASKNETNLVITPELSLWGYPPRDLLLDPRLIDTQWAVLDNIAKSIAQEISPMSLLIGIAEPTPDLQLPKLFNSIALVDQNGWKVIARKQLLPTYDVFDEKRYFRPSSKTGTLKIQIKEKDWNIGVTICEDLWVEEKLQSHRIKGPDPVEKLVNENIDLLLNLSASPFSPQKELLRQKLGAKAASRLKCPVVYLNQVGGNDELVFDGASFIVNEKGKLLFSLPRCRESIEFWEPQSISQIQSLPQQEELLFEMLVLGVRDYAKKCGFSSTLVGLSGGIDSSLVAVIASAALGKENTYGVLMPSPWSSDGSIKDALALAKRLGIETQTIPIYPVMDSYDNLLREGLQEPLKGIAAENLQARIRGTMLMAIANHKKHLLLSTGNKSELAVGYCTLYGDMNGGLAVIGDVYKTSVYNLCEWLDCQDSLKCKSFLGLPKLKELIGLEIRNKAPSAELRPDQLDSDSLPEYEKLDPILKSFIEDRSNSKDLINKGFDPDLVNKIELLLKQSEFKRRQAPPMLKVSNQAFGSGWRLPIAATYSR